MSSAKRKFNPGSHPIYPPSEMRMREIIASHIELNDAQFGNHTFEEYGTVYACNEHRCAKIGMANHSHRQRPYLIYRDVSRVPKCERFR